MKFLKQLLVVIGKIFNVLVDSAARVFIGTVSLVFFVAISLYLAASIVGYESESSIKAKHSFLEQASACNIAHVKNYINSNNNVNIMNADGATALINAAENGCSIVVQTLLESGANIHKKRKRYGSALERTIIARSSIDPNDVETLTKYDLIINMLGNTYEPTELNPAI